MPPALDEIDPMTDTHRNDLLIRLLDELERYYQHVSADDDDGRRTFREVAAWFESTDTSDASGFERICKTLELDAAHIRCSLARRTGEIRRALFPPRTR
jgi:hypothetical protein